MTDPFRGFAGKRLWIVEADAPVGAQEKAILERHGAQVEIFANPQAARVKLESLSDAGKAPDGIIIPDETLDRPLYATLVAKIWTAGFPTRLAITIPHGSLEPNMAPRFGAPVVRLKKHGDTDTYLRELQTKLGFDEQQASLPPPYDFSGKTVWLADGNPEEPNHGLNDIRAMLESCGAKVIPYTEELLQTGTRPDVVLADMGTKNEPAEDKRVLDLFTNKLQGKPPIPIVMYTEAAEQDKSFSALVKRVSVVSRQGSNDPMKDLLDAVADRIVTHPPERTLPM